MSIIEEARPIVRAMPITKDLSVGLRVAETAGEALYHDGRYFVTLGYQAGVVVFAE